MLSLNGVPNAAITEDMSTDGGHQLAAPRFKLLGCLHTDGACKSRLGGG